MGLIKKFVALFILILYIILIISPNKSFALSCSESNEPRELFKRHDSVFIGKVKESTYEEVGTLNPKSRVTFEVNSGLKGDNSENVTIVTTAGSEFLNGKEYLVYAYKTTKKNYLYKYEQGELATDTWCGGTKEFSLASYDLEEIAELKKRMKFSILLRLFRL
ncbi:hypothetical protein GC102_32885 [Paenibacillus sp. LMG 31460]|uniref:Tissue inhibitor of metalloproteinase n=1 Tax=Paenibacillus germinis TaxID=2654979 RepID=A0ABX1ZE33_9BACL|nr:hypothetical protein [Paenibacillus germinis]NOU90501.1 hypothetical protein [Paenibacillus germinis]